MTVLLFTVTNFGGEWNHNNNKTINCVPNSVIIVFLPEVVKRKHNEAVNQGCRWLLVSTCIVSSTELAPTTLCTSSSFGRKTSASASICWKIPSWVPHLSPRTHRTECRWRCSPPAACTATFLRSQRARRVLSCTRAKKRERERERERDISAVKKAGRARPFSGTLLYLAFAVKRSACSGRAVLQACQ